ncbi:MAG TPA: YraN family protein [Thermoleophilaceae bacterium]|nr:YraN family protein [Thermoleophilaceae bacterium]
MVEDPRRRLGARGEEIAARHLEQRGYKIVDRNFRTRYGELDLVAAGDGCLVFCEVKTRVERSRSSPLGPLASVGPRKRRQVRLMAREWLGARRSRLARGLPELRFDAIGVTLDRGGELVALEHLDGAF